MKNLVFRHLAAATAIVVCASIPVAAEELQLVIQNGRVTLIAEEVPLRQILSEWARVGQTKIVNAEKLVGPPVSLRLENRPEKEVLDVLLRSAAGYMAAPREVAVASLSVYDRIMILPTSVRPSVSSIPQAFPQQRPQPQPFPMPTPVEDDQADPPAQAVPPGLPPNMGNQPGPVPNPAGTYAQPGAPGQQQPTNTLPRPGMLPAPQPQMPNPYVPGRGTPPPVRPGGPGGPGGN